MRVCYFGTYDESFPRNRVLIQGLLENGAQVLRCQAKLWSGTQDKITGVKGFRPASGGLALSLLHRMAKSYLQLWREHRRVGPYDIMVVGYAGHLDVLRAWVLTRLRRKPLVFDAFLSLYDTVVEDRKLIRPGSILARGLWLLDKVSCSLADLVFLDTQVHIDWYSERYGLKKERFRRVLAGAEALEIHGLANQHNSNPFKVLYFGNFIPLHGVEHILGAARELRGHNDISFELVGEGQTYDEAQRLAQDNGLSNVRFIHGWFPTSELANRVREAAVCLGIFGTGKKADLVIPQKVAFSLALGRPVLTRDSPAVREVFTPGRDIMVCQAGSPQSLAASILALKGDAALRRDIAQEGYRRFQESFCPKAIGKSVKEILTTLCEVG
ncbi:MAG: glycosyltransferase [Dehalococcoidia bacterium]|nr:glycosyltransferase [Dehalococcoidia bacterium]